MENQYTELTREISKLASQIRKAIPDTMKAFAMLSQSATADGEVDQKTKEYVALAIGIATKCDDCIGFHTSALVKMGATRDELMEILGVCVYMGGGPSLMYAAHALKAFDEFASTAKG